MPPHNNETEEREKCAVAKDNGEWTGDGSGEHVQHCTAPHTAHGMCCAHSEAEEFFNKNEKCRRSKEEEAKQKKKN